MAGRRPWGSPWPQSQVPWGPSGTTAFGAHVPRRIPSALSFFAVAQVKEDDSVEGDPVAIDHHQLLGQPYKISFVHLELVEHVSPHDAHHCARVAYGSELGLCCPGGCLGRPDVELVVDATVNRGAGKTSFYSMGLNS